MATMLKLLVIDRVHGNTKISAGSLTERQMRVPGLKPSKDATPSRYL